MQIWSNILLHLVLFWSSGSLLDCRQELDREAHLENTPSEPGQATTTELPFGDTTTVMDGNHRPAALRPAEEPRELADESSPELTTSSSIANQDTTTHLSSIIEDAPTTTTTTTMTTTTTTTKAPGRKKTTTTLGAASDCNNDSYCLNGGTCVVYENGQIGCICPEEFYGARCQTRNICKTLVVDSLTGDQICASIQRNCLKSDKFFRCECHEDEYFVFKADHYPMSSSSVSGGGGGDNNHRPASKQGPGDCDGRTKDAGSSRPPTIAYDSLVPPAREHDNGQTGRHSTEGEQLPKPQEHKSYLAECRRIDKCLGMRCRQMSEVCVDGQCRCNQNLGYIRDPGDSLCKLLDPCRMPRGPGEGPICGQAKCVATYNGDLFKCLCPIGTQPVLRDGDDKSTTQCALVHKDVCRSPLLNRCQHLCQIDAHNKSYKCTCFPGYHPGARPGVDDHLCFFDEHLIGSESESGLGDGRHSRSLPTDEKPTYTFRAYLRETVGSIRQQASGQNGDRANTFAYDTIDNGPATEPSEPSAGSGPIEGKQPEATEEKKEYVIKRELAVQADRRRSPKGQASIHADRHEQLIGDMNNNNNNNNRRHSRDYYGGLEEGADEYGSSVLSAQERCSMYCEENKICVLEKGTRDSYRCVCDRQGYVSVGDRCLDWCSAAEFSHNVQSSVDSTCLSGLCKAADIKPSLVLQHKRLRNYNNNNNRRNSEGDNEHDDDDDEKQLELLSQSSWRPTFECDCSTSPRLVKDPETRLCKLDFQEILRPCLPGNEGHIDCVQNKNAYCAVMHRREELFFQDLRRDKQVEGAKGPGASPPATPPLGPTSSTLKSQQEAERARKARAKERAYTCVCSPEKKFLVDKPRNKARCIDRCDLLNNECGRFNRMCRPAYLNHEDIGFNGTYMPLMISDDGTRMTQFTPTGCECLPGFNVPSTEIFDFLPRDDNNLPIIPSLLQQQQQQPHHHQPQQLEPAHGQPTRTTKETSAGAHQAGLSTGHHEDQWLQAELARELNAQAPDLLGANGQELMNIDSRCLLDYDVVEFHASFKAPADFEPNWIKIRNRVPLESGWPQSKSRPAPSDEASKQRTVLKGDDDDDQYSYDSHATNSRQGGQRPCKSSAECLLKVPDFMRSNIGELHKGVVFVGQCFEKMGLLSHEAYAECIRYRYWMLQKLRAHYADWRSVMARHLRRTFDLMDGNIRVRVNKCQATIRRLSTVPRAFEESMEGPPVQPEEPGPDNNQIKPAGSSSGPPGGQPATTSATATASSSSSGSSTRPPETNDQWGESSHDELGEISGLPFDPLDQYALIDADVDCELTIHSASDDSAARHARKVLLEKQLPRFIFNEPNYAHKFGHHYYLMAPSVLIEKESFDQLAKHRKAFSPCKSDYAYCDKQTRCEMVDTVNFSCTCEYGYTPIGSRDIYQGDSRLEVCEDIDECLFDVCKENGLENKSICINEIGDYKCRCIAHHIGDNKRYCNHICNVIACKFGECRIPDEHHAYCECWEGYREADCSVLDPSVALRKANMIICGSIFTSVLLLAITLAISLNSQLKKTKKKLKRLQAAQEAAQMFEFPAHQQPFRSRMSKVSVCS